MELGRVLKFNNAEWGFIDYKKGKLTVLPLENKSIKDNKKVTFKVGELAFKNIYSKSSEASNEVIEFLSKEKKEREDLLNQLKSGVKFIGNDNEEYTLLKLKGKKVIFYKSGDDIYTANSEFVKSLTGEFNNDYINHLIPVETKKEYNALTNEEKVKIAINYCKKSYSGDDVEFEILEIGNIISGEAFYHEVDAYYELIGLQIKYKEKFDFQEDFSTEVGFFPIYIGKLPDYYPISFDESYGNLDFTEHSYTNGCGDEIEVDKILISKDKLQNIAF